MKPLSDDEIDDACDQSFASLVNRPEFLEGKPNFRSIHRYGFCDGGAVASERGAAVLEVLLRASERCLKHYDKIRPKDQEPSAMVEELRKAIKIARGQ